jgi:hypothetical protein
MDANLTHHAIYTLTRVAMRMRLPFVWLRGAGSMVLADLLCLVFALRAKTKHLNGKTPLCRLC